MNSPAQQAERLADKPEPTARYEYLGYIGVNDVVYYGPLPANNECAVYRRVAAEPVSAPTPIAYVIDANEGIPGARHCWVPDNEGRAKKFVRYMVVAAEPSAPTLLEAPGSSVHPSGLPLVASSSGGSSGLA